MERASGLFTQEYMLIVYCVPGFGDTVTSKADKKYLLVEEVVNKYIPKQET